MRQSLGVLGAVDGADAEGKKSSEDAGDGGIRSGADRPGGRRRSANGRIHRLRRDESGCRSGAFQTGCKTRLAVDDSANVAGAVGAERLAAGAAKRDCGNIAVSGAVHTNLLY